MAAVPAAMVTAVIHSTLTLEVILMEPSLARVCTGH